MLALRYPRFEIIVVDDGSTDDTFERLREAVRPGRGAAGGAGARSRTAAQVLSVHVARGNPETLTVVRKANGGKADALNVGINLARHPLVCMVDADSVLDPRRAAVGGQAVRRRPAAGGRVRRRDPDRQRLQGRWAAVSSTSGCPGSGCSAHPGGGVPAGVPAGPHRLVPARRAGGHLRRVRHLPPRPGRARSAAWPTTPSARTPSWSSACTSTCAQRGEDYRVIFVAEPVSWSEAPSRCGCSAGSGAAGTGASPRSSASTARMIGNPRYGRIGLLALPYYVVFELLAPFVELAALVLVPLGLWAHAVDFDVRAGGSRWSRTATRCWSAWSSLFIEEVLVPPVSALVRPVARGARGGRGELRLPADPRRVAGVRGGRGVARAPSGVGLHAPPGLRRPPRVKLPTILEWHSAPRS